MGGRGSSSGGGGGGGGGGWKKQLREAAKKGQMPSAVMGSQEARSAIFKEIDKIYSMPETKASIVDQGNGVWINYGGTVKRSSYPSGSAASQAEKRGVTKWLLYRNR